MLDYDRYVFQTIKQGFNVRIAAIRVRRDGTPEDPTKITGVNDFAHHNGIRNAT